METRNILFKRKKSQKKNFLNAEDLDRIIHGLYERKTRSERSRELEGMDVKLKDLKYYSKEDVEELRRLNKHRLKYRLYFSWLWDHFPKMVVVVLTLCLWVYWFGWKTTFLAFLPLSLMMFIMITFIRLTRG